MFVTDIRASDDRSPWGEFWFEPVSLRTSAGMRVSGDTALRLSAVYGCVRVLAETMACLPFCMYKPRAGGQGQDPVTDHWLYRLIAKRPNDWQTPFEWIEMLAGHLALRGNCYNLIIANRRGEIEQLIPQHPDRVRMELLDNGSFRYVVKDRAGNETRYARGEIWHVRGLSSDGYMGMNPVAIARETIGLGLAAQDYGARFFANDAKPFGGWIEFAGSFKDKAAKDTFRESWQNAQGGENRGKMAVLENGMKYHEIGLNNKDAQFLEARQFQVPEICRLFRVPPHMVADLSRSTNNNIEWQSLEFVKFTMTPWVERWESSIEYSLLPEDDELEVEFDFDNLERGDMKTRGDFYASAISAGGWMTRNEARGKEKLNPLDGLDEPLEPMNMKGANEPDPAPAPPLTPGQDAAPADDGSDARLRAMIAAAAQRVVRKEAAATAKLWSKNPELVAFNAAVATFYSEHAVFVAEVMVIDPARARQWCDQQCDALMDARDPAKVIEALAKSDGWELAALAVCTGKT